MRKTALTVTLSLALSVAGPLAAFAQGTATPPRVGVAKEVKGLVTMSFGSQVATLQAGTPIYSGSRVVTSSSGTAHLSFDNGCEVDVQPDQFLVVDDQKGCATPVALAPADAGSTFAARDALPLLGAALLAGAVARVGDARITPTPR